LTTFTIDPLVPTLDDNEYWAFWTSGRTNDKPSLLFYYCLAIFIKSLFASQYIFNDKFVIVNDVFIEAVNDVKVSPIVLKIILLILFVSNLKYNIDDE
jgi:hypothetical protein